MTFENKQWAAIFMVLVVIEGALLYKLVAAQTETSSSALVIAICTLGILLLLSSRVESLRSISVTTKGFKAELAALEKKTSENERAITGLILGSMGADTYKNLKKLAEPPFGPFRKDPYMGLETELYHLRNLGYVALKKGTVPSIHDIPNGDQKELSDFVEITAKGRKYIHLREQYTFEE